MTDEKPRSDTDVRADDQARVGSDAVERRAVGAGTVVRNRRAVPDADVQRAESRGRYRDLEGRARIVGAGQPIPDGWERIESATVADRVGTVPTAQGDDDVSAGGATTTAKPKAKPKS